MRLPSRILFLLLIFAAPAFAAGPDDAALQALWDSQQNAPADHQAVIRAAAAFERRFPASPLLPVARGLAAWNLLESGDFSGAKTVLEKMAAANADPIAAMGAEMARRWLTRLDRDQVVTALQKAYAEDIEYPSSLAALPPESRPPVLDRWGAPWSYTPAAFTHLQTGDRQTFLLESTRLGPDSDLTRALARPYGAGFTFKPIKLLPPIGGKSVVTFQDAAGRIDTLSEGAAGKDLGLAYIGDEVLILTTGDYWSIQPRPSS